MKIYTKTGDKGTTSLFGGTRISKADIRIEAYGTVDELNSYVGLIRDVVTDTTDNELLFSIQKELFTLGSMLATKPGSKQMSQIPKVSEAQIEVLENAIDEINKVVEPLQFFILPGGHPHISYCHIARCVCRRAERITVHLSENEEVDYLIIKYLNRLSDYLFTLARKLARDLNVGEVKWMP